MIDFYFAVNIFSIDFLLGLISGILIFVVPFAIKFAISKFKH